MIFENNTALIVMLCNFKVNSKVQCDYYFGKPHKQVKEIVIKSRSRLSQNYKKPVNDQMPWPAVTYTSNNGKTEYIV